MKLSTALPAQQVAGPSRTNRSNAGEKADLPQDGYQPSRFDAQDLKNVFSSSLIGLSAGGASLIPLAGGGAAGALAGCLATEAANKLMGSEASNGAKLAGVAVGGVAGAVLSAMAIAEMVQGNNLPLAALAVGTAAVAGASHWISEK